MPGLAARIRPHVRRWLLYAIGAIALIGATGNVGQRVTAEATSRGHEVTAIARNVDSVAAGDKVKAVAADLRDEDQMAEAIRGHDAAVMSVRTMPGRTSNTPMPASASRSASPFVKAESPALLTQ